MIDKQFVTAGSAIFTVGNPTGTHYTFKVRGKDDERGGKVFFVSLLTGPDNEADYTYLGLLDAGSGDVRLTKASRYHNDSMPVRVARWALGLVWRGATVPAGYHLHHEGRCGRCGRMLTTPESVQRGLGPECAEKILG